MNRIYTLSNDGRLWYGEKNSTSFELLELGDMNGRHVLVKRLSSCDWCLWLISSSFQVYLFVFKLDTPFEHTDICYQNQRRYNLLGKTFVDKLLPSDRWNYSDKSGQFELKKDSFKLPSASWLWKTDWQVELINDSDEEGFEYSVDFPNVYFPQFFYTACVRRRKWIRTRFFANYEKLISIPSPSKADSIIIDISIGGWLMPYCEKNYLSVWIISNGGNLYFRKGVSNQNLEGTEWYKVELPFGKLALSCTCSCKGDLWLVTYDGEILIRTKINRNKPYGSGWIIIDNPSENGIRQIGLGSSTVWALDNSGKVYYRVGLNEETPQGVRWLSIPSKMTNISVAANNIPWCIDANDFSLYFRNGVDPEHEPSGIEWKKVILKCKRVFFSSISSESNEQMIENIPEEENINLIPAEAAKEVESIQQVSVEPVTYFFEDDPDFSIYDTNEESNQNTSAHENTIIEEKNDRNSIKNDQINLDQYLTQKGFNNVEEIQNELSKTTQSLDDFIQRYKNLETEQEQECGEPNTKEDPLSLSKLSLSTKNGILKNSSTSLSTKNRSLSQLSTLSDDSSKTLSTFCSRMVQSETASLYSADSNVEFYNSDFKCCNSNNFNVDMVPLSWYNSDSSSEVSSLAEKANFKILCKTASWRQELLNDLKTRNLRETINIDKISVPYENDNTWANKEEFKFMDKNKKLYNCILEINHQANESTQKGKSSSNTGNNNRKILTVKAVNRKMKVLWEIKIDFKKIVLITRFFLDKEKFKTPCFAIFICGKSQPYLFLTTSEKKLNDWINQLNIYCYKLTGLSSYLNACTFVSSYGFAYFAYFNVYRPLFFNQIDGHFKVIEKHFNGITLGLGENGKLWYLTTSNNYASECYKGPYPQTDELQFQTYENQRWNAITGVMGLRNGFTVINFPTDRYLWSDETGKVRRRKEDCILPCSLFSWSTNWQVDFSTPNGVDVNGWQYAFDYPYQYHPIFKYMADFVRRRRWLRKYKITTHGLWKELNQKHTITSISFDQEVLKFNRSALLMATDSDGFVLASMIHDDISSLENFKWKHVPSDEKFMHISIGINYKIWAIDMNGHCFYRLGSSESNQTGSSWTRIKFNESEELNQLNNVDIKFKMLSVGNDCVWAVSQNDELYFRENVTKSFPEGTSWTKLDLYIKYVTVNYKNEVFAITNEAASKPNCLLYRDNIGGDNLKGSRWLECLNMQCKTFSNRGTLEVL